MSGSAPIRRLARRLVRRALLTVGAFALGVALFLVDSIALGGPGPDPAKRAAPGGTVAAAAPRGSQAELRARLERVPGDWVAWAALGVTYLEQAGRSGDSSTLAQAEATFTESLRVRPQDNPQALTGQAALAAARNDFAAAAALATEATTINAFNGTALGVLSDALVELGRYEEAAAALQSMADLSGDSSTLARISRLRELHGDTTGAQEAMERSLAGARSPAAAAYASFALGELAFNAGDLTAAQSRYAESRTRDPGHLPAVAGAAKVDAARGNPIAAVTAYRGVVAASPLPHYATEFGDLLASLGRQDEAAQQYATAAAQIQLIRANGGNPDLAAALFAADRGDPEEALALARREHAARKSIHTDDALAWALHGVGRDSEALVLSDGALRLGTRDASLHFHRGMIEAALGLGPAATVSLETALAINPHFSTLHAPAARAQLDRLADAARTGAAG